MLSPTLT
ncbi:hypothetical protein VCBJG01_2437, partial [Vibrio cholerae BJG-01]